MEETKQVEEFQVRLTPADAALLRALAGVRQISPEMLAQSIVGDALVRCVPLTERYRR